MSQGKKTILIADDSYSERQTVCASLAPGGYRILEVSDGVAAIAVAHAERPSLVILDVYLPRMNGVAVCRALKALCTEANYLPILMVSSRASVNARIEGLRSGADDFMAKPIDPKELRTRVDALLRLLDMPATPVGREDWRSAGGEPRRSSMDEWRNDFAAQEERLTYAQRTHASARPLANHRPSANSIYDTSSEPSVALDGYAAVDLGPENGLADEDPTASLSAYDPSSSVARKAESPRLGATEPHSVEFDEDPYGNHLIEGLPERVARRMSQEFARARRFSEPLACLVVGVDGYSSLIRRHGESCELELHVIHDAAARAVRQIDLVFELENGRLLVLLPNTHFIGAVAAAERMWREMRGIRLRSVGRTEITASVGVSFFPSRDTQSVRDLVRLAGIALQVAQGEGEGRICLYQHQRYIYTPEAA
jgi:diguanylate cyclase (GGDEF)-like protein